VFIFLHLKPDVWYSSLSFVRLNYNRTMDKLAINWQNFAQARLQLKLTFRIWPLVFHEKFITKYGINFLT